MSVIFHFIAGVFSLLSDLMANIINESRVLLVQMFLQEYFPITGRTIGMNL